MMRRFSPLVSLRVRSRGPWHDLAARLRVGLIIALVLFVIFPAII